MLVANFAIFMVLGLGIVVICDFVVLGYFNVFGVLVVRIFYYIYVF